MRNNERQKHLNSIRKKLSLFIKLRLAFTKLRLAKKDFFANWFL